MRIINLVISLILFSVNYIFSQETNFSLLANLSDYRIHEEKLMETISGNPITTELYNSFVDSSNSLDSVKLKILNPKIQIRNEIDLYDSTISKLLVLKDKIYTATTNGTVYSIYPDGKINWQHITDAKISNSILGSGDLVVVMSDAGDLYTINSNNGDPVQSIGIGEPISSDIIFTDINYNDLNTKGIVFGTAYGNVYCYELYSLQMVWGNNLPEEKVITGTFLIKDKIIIQTADENYYCLDSDNGILIWKWEPKTKSEKQNFRSKVISKGNSIYLTDNEGNLYSIDLLLGTDNWNKKRVYASEKVYYANDELILHNTKNEVLFIDPYQGKVQKEVKLPNEFINSSPTCLIENGKEILLGFDNGYICELDEKKIFKELLYLGNSQIVSIIKANSNFFVTNNAGKLIEFTIN